MISDLHPVVGQIKNLLEENGVQYQYFEHEAVRTSEEAHRLRPGYKFSQGAKALIVRLKMPDGSRIFSMFVLPADRKLSNEKVRGVTGAKSFSFATKEEADEITRGIEFGGVPPFGNLFGIAVYLDPAIREHEEILFNCGDRRATIIMKLSDYIVLVSPKEVSVSE